MVDVLSCVRAMKRLAMLLSISLLAITQMLVGVGIFDSWEPGYSTFSPASWTLICGLTIIWTWCIGAKWMLNALNDREVDRSLLPKPWRDWLLGSVAAIFAIILLTLFAQSFEIRSYAVHRGIVGAGAAAVIAAILWMPPVARIWRNRRR